MVATAASSTFVVKPCSYEQARCLVAELGLSEPVAMTLVRRGYGTPSAAREFLEASESHDPFEFDQMEEVVALLLAAASRGRQVTVHGDYDTDGVCATAILVAALRDAGAPCDWYLPDRLADGYGLSADTVRRLAARGTQVLVTADCGIACPDEVALARELGLEVVVTDHHEPGERLPECPLLHPRISGYPFEELCGTGVAHKLAAALRQRSGTGSDDAGGLSELGAAAGGASPQDLDLVALATVADLVPLRGENRALVRAGLAEARRGRRTGLKALIAAAGGEAGRLDEGDFAFRLAPRINAAGRLYRADAGVELMLTADEARAKQIAVELDRANHERRDAEREALAGAERALAELPLELREGAAIVVAGEGWHPGVVGIVASRLVERHWRPAIVLGIDSKGRAKGSGRSIPGFDLLEGLRSCAEHLGRFGGHRAAAGLELDAADLDAFRSAFAAHAEATLRAEDLVRSDPVDAVVGGESLGLAIAEELALLAPFGKGNPEPRFLVPAARVQDVRPMGEGRHARFSLHSGSRRALGVAFGTNGELDRAASGGPLDVAVRLEVNRWNGTVEPRVVLRDLYPGSETEKNRNPAVSSTGEAAGSGTTPAGGEGTAGAAPAGCDSPASGEEWWRRFDVELEAEIRPTGADPAGAPSSRLVADRRGCSGVACIAGLLSTGGAVLALCADVSRRRELAERAAAPIRFGGGDCALACGSCSEAGISDRVGSIAAAGHGLALVDWAALQLAPELASAFEHVVLVDPPPEPRLEALAGQGEGYLHLAWGAPELELALRVHEAEWPLRPALAACFRRLRDADAGDGEAITQELLPPLLAGSSRHPRSPEQAARPVRVLEELGLVHWQRGGTSRALGVVSSKETDLELSAAFRAFRARYEEGRRFLNSKTLR